MICKFCKKEILHDDSVDGHYFPDIMQYVGEVADTHGVEALTEIEQTAYHGIICLACYLMEGGE